MILKFKKNVAIYCFAPSIMSKVVNDLFKERQDNVHREHPIPDRVFVEAIAFCNSLRHVLPDLPQPSITTLTQSIHLTWIFLNTTDGRNDFFNVAIRLHPERDCYMAYLPTTERYYEIELDYNNPDSQELMSEFESKHFVYDC